MICVACGASGRSSPVFRKSLVFPTVGYVRCYECGTLYISTRPTAIEITKFYRRFYMNDGTLSLVAKIFRWLRSVSEQARAHSLISYAGRQGCELARLGSLVDIGAGNGMLTRALRKAGPSNLHIVSVDAAADVLNLQNVANETWLVSEPELLKRLQETSLRFGGVFFSHTLEHFVDPLAILRAVSSRLVDGGCVFVDCPSGLHPLYLDGNGLAIPDFVFLTPDGVRAIGRLSGYVVSDLRGISPGPSFLYRPSGSVFLMYVASCLFLTRSAIKGDGYFTGGNPLWWRFTLSKSSALKT